MEYKSERVYMMIIESQEEIEIFKLYWDKEPCIIYPIWADLDKHPLNNKLSFLYIRFRDDETDDGDVVMDFIIPFDHNDCLNIDIDLSNSTQAKLVYNKKGLLQTDIDITNMVDINAELFFNEFNKYPNGLDISEIESLTSFYIRQGFRDNLGKIIPITKWSEVLRMITNPIEDRIQKIPYHITRGLHSKNWIDKRMIPTLSKIERIGFRADKQKFNDRWPEPHHTKQLNGDIIYTEYNPYTLTSRPSNRHGGINFGALNKSDGSRDVFIPREGNSFFSFDYDAYHVRLIGKMIDYKLPDSSVHQWLADKYGCSYEESKGRTFRILYGGASDEDKKIPFFKQTDDFIQMMWVDVQMRGYFVTKLGRRIKLEWIENPTPQKVFNYFLQATETEINIEIINELLENGYGKYFVLYTYDSFLFDISLNIEWKTILKDIKKILEKHGFPVHGTYGTTYGKV